MPKDRQLVSQYLENISREALEKYQEIIRGYVRDRQGVYALYRRRKLYYVGLARNLRSSLNSHLKDHHAESWDTFSIYLTIGETHLKELESLILKIIQPRGNKLTGKFVNAEDLRRRFAAAMKNYWQHEMRIILPKKLFFKDKEISADEKPRGLVLSKFFDRATKLRARYRGKILTAWVNRRGIIRFRGRRLKSPSKAGSAACRGKSCNGWTFWRYERAPGDWVTLDNLRK